MVVGNKSIKNFLLKIFGFYIFWLFADYFLSRHWILFNKLWTFGYHIFLKIIHGGSIFFLENFLGADIVSSYNAIAIVGTFGIIIGNNCVGFGLTYGFVALIVSFPGQIKNKLWFIPLGIGLISILNITRIVLLVLSNTKENSLGGVEYHELFNNIIYILIFLMWIFWINFTQPKKEVSSVKIKDKP